MVGFAAVAGQYASARDFVLVNVGDVVPISRVEWVVYDTGRRSAADASEHRCVLRIRTSCGIAGWADVPIWMMPDQSTIEQIRTALLGRDAYEHSGIWRQFYEQGLPLGPLGAVDIALWDLRGRIEGKPVHALLGARRQKVKAYLTTSFNLGDPQQYAEQAIASRQAGLHGIKIHPYIEWGTGRNGLSDAGFPDRDMAVYRTVRDAVGADYACMADNSRTYTYNEALRVGRLLDDLAYEWYESPMPETDDWRKRYIALASELKTPVCGPETHPDSYPARISWIASKACDIGRIDASFGGFTACLELARACEAAGVPLELRDIGRDAYPHLQLIAASSDSRIKYCEVSSLSRDSRIQPGRATAEPIFDNDGYIPIPQTPGMGVELDWDYIHTHRVS